MERGPGGLCQSLADGRRQYQPFGEYAGCQPGDAVPVPEKVRLDQERQLSALLEAGLTGGVGHGILLSAFFYL